MSPLPRLGKFSVVKSPVSVPMYAMSWNESPAVGTKPFTRLTSSVPANDTLPVTLSESYCPVLDAAELDVENPRAGLGEVASDRGVGGGCAITEDQRAGIGHIGRQRHAVVQLQNASALNLDRRELAQARVDVEVCPRDLANGVVSRIGDEQTPLRVKRDPGRVVERGGGGRSAVAIVPGRPGPGDRGKRAI